MEVLTAAQMREADRQAIEGEGIPGLSLMENAGRGIAEALFEDEPELTRRRVLILCGKGNNGGDGLVVARLLVEGGVAARVVLLARGDELRGDAATNRERAIAAGVEIREAPDEDGWADARPWLAEAELVVDAMLGTGIRGGARGIVATAIEDLEACDVPVASIDLPSGIDADREEHEGVAVRATRTYTLCRPKVPLVGRAAAWAGDWCVVPIGIPDEIVAGLSVDLFWNDPLQAARLLPERPPEMHKGAAGHLLAFAGSPGKAGAAVLLGRAALRSGVGLVTVASGAGAQALIAVQQAELMTEPLPESGGSIVAGAAQRLLELTRTRQAVAIGPGLGTDGETGAVVREFVAATVRPLVIDADGLNAFDAAAALGLAGRPALITPHPGEAARLLGTSAAEIQADRLGRARALAAAAGAVCVLKGHLTVIAHPDGRATVNTNGNPGMASAGTGDVLTGVAGALLAAGLSPWDAARLAVFLHGDAGDLAALDRGTDGLIASDVIERLPDALRGLREPENAW